MEIIRPIQKEDLVICSKILEDAYSEEPYNETFEKGSALEYIRSKYACGKNHSFVIELDGVVSGFLFASLSYWSDGPQGVMEEIVLLKDLRGKGYSQKLNDYLENHFNKMGISTGILWVKKDSPAHKFHKKNGYFDAKDLTLMFKNF